MSYRLVEDCLNWTQMDGQSTLAKKLNAYLCCRLIIQYNVPSNECVSYADAIASSRGLYDVKKIFEMLWKSFGSIKETNEERQRIMQISEGVMALIMIEGRAKE